MFGFGMVGVLLKNWLDGARRPSVAALSEPSSLRKSLYSLCEPANAYQLTEGLTD